MTFDADQLSRRVERLFAAEGVELVDFKWAHVTGGVNIDLKVDLPDGGIGLDVCAELNRRLARAMEEEGWLSENFTLTVCSPGLDWPLKGERDFRRVKGRQVWILLTEPLDGRIEWTGSVVKCDGEGIELRAAPAGRAKAGPGAGGVPVTRVPYGLIKKAVQHI